MDEPTTRRSAWMRRLTVIGTGLALVLLSGSAAFGNHAWDGYHWEKSSSGPEVLIGSNLDPKWSGFYTDALDDWDDSVLTLTQTSAGGLKRCGAVNGQVEVCNDEYGNRGGGWLGVATIWADGDHLVKATVKLNDSFLFGGSIYSSPEFRQMVMCHEIGHTFGLGHRDENFYNTNVGSCLDYTMAPAGGPGNPSNLYPDAHDFQELFDIYAHTDSASGGGGDDDGDGPGGNCPPRNPNCSGAVSKAPPFSQASRANGPVYVDHLPNGLTRIKHILWVPVR